MGFLAKIVTQILNLRAVFSKNQAFFNSINNHQSPITNHQSPITNHQSPETGWTSK